MGTSGYTNKPYHTTSWFLRLTNGTATAMFSITVDYQRCFFLLLTFTELISTQLLFVYLHYFNCLFALSFNLMSGW